MEDRSHAHESKQAPCLKPGPSPLSQPGKSRARPHLGVPPPSPNRANRECGHTWVSLPPSPNRANREYGHSLFVCFSTFFRISHCMVTFLFLKSHWLEVVTVKKTIHVDALSICPITVRGWATGPVPSL